MRLIGIIDEKYQELCKKKFFYLIAAIPWIIFIFVNAYIFYKNQYIAFESNDDAYLNLITTGTFGKKYALNAYNNVLMGWLFTVLYSISASHNWYIIIEFLLIFAGFAIFGVCNIIRNRLLKGYVTNLIIYWSLVFSLVCRMNYSKTAVFTMIVGLFMLGTSVDNKSYSKVGSIICQAFACMFIFFGGLYRKDSTLVVIPFALVIAAYLILKHKKEAIRETLKRMLPFVAVTFAIAFAWIANAIVYNSDAEWKYYSEFNEACTRVRDYPLPGYEENRESYEAIGLSLVDVAMLQQWFYADSDVFTVDRLNSISEIRLSNIKKVPIAEKIEGYADSFISIAGTYTAVYAMLFLFLALSINSSSKAFGFKLVTMLIGAGLVMETIIMERPIQRAVFVGIIAAMITMLFFTCEKEHKRQEKWGGLICLALVGIYTFYGCNHNKIEAGFENIVYDRSESNVFYSYMAEHSDKLFTYNVLYEGGYLTNSYRPFDVANEFMRDNNVPMGGWLIPSPIYTNNLERFGDKHNLFKVLAENSDAYLIFAGQIEGSIIDLYMQQHYGATGTVVDTIGGIFNVISFSGAGIE